MAFTDRTDAGRRLAVALAAHRGEPVVVLALPRGGVPVAAEVAEALDAPLDLLLVRKIGAPFDPELAMGAVAEDGETVRNADVVTEYGVDEATFEAARTVQLAEIERRRAAYLKGRPRAEIAGRVAIVVDDGIATGATIRAALRAVRAKEPSRLVLAAPVAPPETLAALRGEADEIVCLSQPMFMGAIAMHYDDFRQVSDAEVAEILARMPIAGAALSAASPRHPPA